MKNYIVITNFIYNQTGESSQSTSHPMTKGQAKNQVEASKNYYEARKNRFTLVSIKIRSIK